MRTGSRTPLSDGSGRARRSEPTQTSFAALRPDEAILAHARHLTQRLRAGYWQEASAVLLRYGDRLRERPLPPALKLLVEAACDDVADDGVELGEGYARRFLTLTGALPWSSAAVARTGASDKQGGKLHLVDPFDPRRSVCGSLKHLSSRNAAARGHFQAALDAYPAAVGKHTVCSRCRSEAHLRPEALEDDCFPVLSRGEGRQASEWATLARGLRRGLLLGVLRAEDDLERAAEAGFAEALCDIAVPRLAAAEWAPLRERLFGTRLRLGKAWRSLYGDSGRAPSEAQWRQVLAGLPDYPSMVLVERDGAGTIVDPAEWRYHQELLDSNQLIPGLLVHCYPALLDLIERELEGDTHLLAGLSADGRERGLSRLEAVWRRADLRRRELPGAAS